MSSPSVSYTIRGEAMARTVVIEQPNYLPWIGYFDLIQQADVWIWYDDVQYTKRDWRNRNRIAAGSAEWLTIPVKTKGRFAQRICDVEIDSSQLWMRRHLESIRRCYARAPFFEPMFSIVDRVFAAGDMRLADLTIRLCQSICAELGLAPEFLRSSELPHAQSDREERLRELCRAVGGTIYLSGPAARKYIDSRAFAAAGIELRYIVYDYLPYARGAQPFVPGLSILDALAWLGARGTADFLATHGRSEREVIAC